MFGRNNDEHSNEYIRPSEEYRAECTDEHGITYENHNDEQRPYDEYNSVENEFSSMLMNGERLLWTGKTEKGAGLKAKGTGVIIMIFPIFWLGFAIFWTIMATAAGGFFGIFGIPFIIAGIVITKKLIFAEKQKYAITDRRVLKIIGKNFSAEMLNNITDITVCETGNNMGYVKYNVIGSMYYRNNQPQTTLSNGFFGIKNPQQAYRILNDAIYANQKSK